MGAGVSLDTALQRGWKSIGFAGPVAFLMVVWAASLGRAFRWGLFWIALAALFLCWARTWVLVPIHQRLVRARDAEWDRYGVGDWHLVELLALLSGDEIDRLRADVAARRNHAVHAVLDAKAPDWDDDDRYRFLTLFIENLSEIDGVFVDPDGNLQAYDA